MTGPILRLVRVAKDFGRIRAISEFTFEAPKGITCLAGANGSGKTTALHLLLGFFPPTAGTVQAFGLDPWHDYHLVRERLTGSVERQELPSDMRCRRLLEHVARMRGQRNASAAAEESLGAVGLGLSGESRIRTLSAGMYQRLLIAFSIVGFPELVVLDEPNANLDPEGRQRLSELLRDLGREKDMSFLVATHLLEELRSVSKWVVIAEAGRIVHQGPPEETPLSPSPANRSRRW